MTIVSSESAFPNLQSVSCNLQSGIWNLESHIITLHFPSTPATCTAAANDTAAATASKTNTFFTSGSFCLVLTVQQYKSATQPVSSQTASRRAIPVTASANATPDMAVNVAVIAAAIAQVNASLIAHLKARREARQKAR
jgi:hypothetical protein